MAVRGAFVGRTSRILTRSLVVSVLALFGGLLLTPNASAEITEFTPPTPFSTPTAIVAGPDGALWFIETGGNQVGRITTGGSFTEFPIPTPFSGPSGITVGPDGALWFTELQNNIGRITTGGSITEFPIPTPASGPEEITVGPDGALWFTEHLAGKIGRITTGGSFTEFTVPTPNSAPADIVAGPDGALWFTERGTEDINKIGRITTGGSFTEFTVPTPDSIPWGITAGPDGALWFTESQGNKIGRITTGGSFTEFPIPTPASDTRQITVGPDGALWFTERAGEKIGRITTDGSITEYPLPTTPSAPYGITAGPDGALWFTENFNRIGRITVPPGPPAALTLSPKAATNVVGTQHCVTATVKDGSANATPGVTVRFSVTGSVSTSGSPATDANGKATFCYQGPELAGTDAISAFADTDNDTSQDPGEPSDGATKVWRLPTSTPLCKVIEGGLITAANGDHAIVGGLAQSDGAGKVKGTELYRDLGPVRPQTVKSIQILALTCSATPRQATIFGTAKVQGSGAHPFRIDVQDLGPPFAGKDTYRILLDTGYDSGVQKVKAGDVLIHKG